MSKGASKTVIRVAVSGALGNMGTLAREAIDKTAGMQYVGGFARTRVPELYIDTDLERMLHERRPEVLVDFTPRPATQTVAR